MGKIIRLDDSLSNKIAAGEVVERPASVVKELVENAIDAGSSKIQVEVEEGGLTKIVVVDNGHGIDADDCELAFQRHATSKIANERDLFHIHTLGFRGEALPSIASVSHVDITTGTGVGPGKQLVFQGGHLIHANSSSSRRGTEIKVTNLFYNTPARLKHLKTIHTELGNISDIMNKLALAHPNVSFTLSHNGKQMLYTAGKGDLAQVLAAIYGVQTAKQSLAFSTSSLDFDINGLMVKPEITRAGRQYVYIFINGRYIKNYPIFNAIIAGYHTLLPIGRYPIAVLHIQMDPTLVDVNVHPAKLEARISKEKELCQLIEEAIKSRYHQLRLIPEVKRKNRERINPSEQQTFHFSEERFHHDTSSHDIVHEPKEQSKTPTSYVDTQSEENEPNDDINVSFEQQSPSEKWKHSEQTTSNQPVKKPLYEMDFDLSQQEKIEEELDQSSNSTERMPILYPIGQMHGTYILAQNEDGLYLIDQHAAQERIKYEYYRDKLADVTNEVQELLVPITFELTAAEYTVIQEYQSFLEKIGLYFEPFGQHSLIIRSHPYWISRGEEKETIEEIIEQLLRGQNVSILKLREELAIMMSCKGSIKANRHLRDDEILALLDELRKAQDPFTCPHGRPVIVHFSTYEMEKMFKRVM